MAPRDLTDPHEAAGHRWFGQTRIRSIQNSEGEWYPDDQTDTERGSEEEENSLHARFNRHLREGHCDDKLEGM